jgi:hypothetical protein
MGGSLRPRCDGRQLDTAIGIESDQVPEGKLGIILRSKGDLLAFSEQDVPLLWLVVI